MKMTKKSQKNELKIIFYKFYLRAVYIIYYYNLIYSNPGK